MPKLYFHLRENSEVLLDPEGIDMPENQVPARALWEARALIAYDAAAGRIDLRPRIDVEDATGRLVHSLRLADAIEILRPD